MVILRLVFVAMSGFGLHQAYRPTLSLGPRWGSMLREAIGTLGMLPGLLLLHDREGHDNVVSAYLLTCFAFGSGVFIGHMVDRMSDEH